MLCRARLIIETEGGASIIARSLSCDDPEWCRSYAEEDLLVLEITTQRIETLINTCNDYFLTIKAAMAAKVN